MGERSHHLLEGCKHGELAESQLAGGKLLSRPEQSSEGGSYRSDDPTQLKPKGRGRKKA